MISINRRVKDILNSHNIRLTKALGQNFLNDENIVSKIVDISEVTKEDLVIEIGPGIGSMTYDLAQRAGKIIAIEIDSNLISALKENLSEFDNVKIMNIDVMKVNISDVIQEEKENYKNVKVVANLPYYITTPIIMKLLEDELGIDMMVFMVQKEVADRMVAMPGKKDYGALSIAVQYYAKTKKMFNVPPQCFIPAPKVDSTIVKLDIYENPPVELMDKKMFFRIVKAAFGQRRKTLINALSNSGVSNISKGNLKGILNELQIEEKQRGETLSIQQFSELANTIYSRIK